MLRYFHELPCEIQILIPNSQVAKHTNCAFCDTSTKFIVNACTCSYDTLSNIDAHTSQKYNS